MRRSLIVLVVLFVLGLGVYFLIFNSSNLSYSYQAIIPTQIQPQPTSANLSTQSQVTINSFSFSPDTLSVKAGTTVTWINNDAVAHTVTSDSEVFSSGSIASGGNFSSTFNTPGTFNYYCNIHPSMKGTVTVTE